MAGHYCCDSSEAIRQDDEVTISVTHPTEEARGKKMGKKGVICFRRVLTFHSAPGS